MTISEFARYASRIRALWTSTEQHAHEAFRADLRESVLAADELSRLLDAKPVGLTGTAREICEDLARFVARLADDRRGTIGAPPLTADEALEMKVLERYITHHRDTMIAADTRLAKCRLELDMREVLQDLTGSTGSELEYDADHWLGRLAPPGVPATGVLRRCSDTVARNAQHKYHARAWSDPTNRRASPAWIRLDELKARRGPSPGPELEQKFGILRSPNQLAKDFLEFTTKAKPVLCLGLLFVDVDRFKALNTKHTEELVDRTLLPELQRFLLQIVRGRGHAYRQGGEEFILALPSHTRDETNAFAERVRTSIADTAFEIGDSVEQLTVSIGAAIWPDDGEDLPSVRSASNHAKNRAKKEGRNCVKWALTDAGAA